MKVLIAIDIANNICILNAYEMNDEQYEFIKEFYNGTSGEDVLEFDTKYFGIELEPGELYMLDVVWVNDWCSDHTECDTYLSVIGGAKISLNYEVAK